ncbi:MAG: hypothetical protein ACK5N0_03960 [Synechococcaceae cyanobacterium]
MLPRSRRTLRGDGARDRVGSIEAAAVAHDAAASLGRVVAPPPALAALAH